MLSATEELFLKRLCVGLTTCSAVCCLPVLLTNVVQRRWKRGVITMATCCVLVFNLNILAGWALDFRPAREGGPNCTAQGVIFHISILGLIQYWLVLALTVRAVVVERLTTFRLARREKYYHAGVAVGCVAFTVPVAITGSFGQTQFFWCWIRDDDIWQQQVACLAAKAA